MILCSNALLESALGRDLLMNDMDISVSMHLNSVLRKTRKTTNLSFNNTSILGMS